MSDVTTEEWDSLAQQLQFWKALALGLKNEMVQRGNRITELEAQLAEQETLLDSMARQLRGHDDE